MNEFVALEVEAPIAEDGNGECVDLCGLQEVCSGSCVGEGRPHRSVPRVGEPRATKGIGARLQPKRAEERVTDLGEVEKRLWAMGLDTIQDIHKIFERDHRIGLKGVVLNGRKVGRKGFRRFGAKSFEKCFKLGQVGRIALADGFVFKKVDGVGLCAESSAGVLLVDACGDLDDVVRLFFDVISGVGGAKRRRCKGREKAGRFHQRGPLQRDWWQRGYVVVYKSGESRL